MAFSLSSSSDEFTDSLIKFFSPVISLFVCPFCSQRGTFSCEILKSSRLNFVCSKKDPCFGSLTSPHFFFECSKQDIQISPLNTLSSNIPISGPKKIKNQSKGGNLFRLLSPDSPPNLNSWGESVLTNGSNENSDDPIFQFSPENISIGRREDIPKQEPSIKDLLLSNNDLSFQMLKLQEMNVKLLSKLQLLESTLQFDSYSPTLPSYHQNISDSRSFDNVGSLEAQPEPLTTTDSTDLNYATESLLASSLPQEDVNVLSRVFSPQGKDSEVESHGNSWELCPENNEPSVVGFGTPRNEDAVHERSVKQAADVENLGTNSSSKPDNGSFIRYLEGTVSPSRLQRAEHSCKKIELGVLNDGGRPTSMKGVSRKLAAIEIDGVQRQPFKAIKLQLREIGIEAESTPSFHFLSSRVLEIITPQHQLTKFIDALVSQKSSNQKPFNKWNITSIQRINL